MYKKSKVKTSTKKINLLRKFYEFKQNNSGGHFVTDEQLCNRMFIEAKNADEATVKALEMGVYFDGVKEGRDCPCCGDRWSSSTEEMVFPYSYGNFTKEDAADKALKYKIKSRKARNFFGNRVCEIVFTDIETYAQFLADEYGWTVPDCRVFYADGRVFETKEKNSQNEKV